MRSVGLVPAGSFCDYIILSCFYFLCVYSVRLVAQVKWAFVDFRVPSAGTYQAMSLDERKARTAANGAEKTETRKQKETEAKADRPWRKKRTKQTGSGYKVADLKSDSGVTWEKKEKAQRCNNKNQHES